MKQSNTRLFALITILFLSSFGFAQNSSTTAKLQSERVKTAPAKPATVDTIQSDIREALAVIDNNYAGEKKLDYNELFKSSIDSALQTLDPHSHYFDAKEAQQFVTDQSSRYFGIGATIGDLSDADGKVLNSYIKATFEGAPANKVGLRYGDKFISFSGQRVMPDGKIAEVKNESLVGKPFPEVRSYLRGPEGTTIHLTVEHLATGKQETVDITRAGVPQPSISEVYMIRPGVGYMRMNGGFNQTTYGEFARGLRDLKAAGMTQLVLDIRDNPGGLVVEAYRVADALLTYGQMVFTQRGRIAGANENWPAGNRTPDRSPIVMLVNRGSASASEILGGALQDHDRALIVGENTFGKGLVQNGFPLDYGSVLWLTIAKYQTPAGRQIQRDYSNGDIYNYLYEGGSFRGEDGVGITTRTHGAAAKTDSGRTVYSGGGINPDVVVKPTTIPIERYNFQQKLANPVFAFALDLVDGKVKGLESYAVNKPIAFDYDIKATDFPITDTVYAAFKKLAVDKYKFNPLLVDHEREFVNRTLRSELVTAAYGSQTSFQVFNEYDDQLLKAIDLLPQAKVLAMQSEKVKSTAKQPIRDNK